MSEANQLARKSAQVEILWWVLSLIAAVAVILPVWYATGYFTFLPQNIIFVVAFITFTRYIFLLRFTFLARRQKAKLAIIFLCIPAVFFMVQELNYFQTFIDENGMEAVIGPLSLSQSQSIGRYLHAEMLLFSVGSVIAASILPFRLGLSIWRTRNRGTV